MSDKENIQQLAELYNQLKSCAHKLRNRTDCISRVNYMIFLEEENVEDRDSERLEHCKESKEEVLSDLKKLQSELDDLYVKIQAQTKTIINY